MTYDEFIEAHRKNDAAYLSGEIDVDDWVTRQDTINALYPPEQRNA